MQNSNGRGEGQGAFEICKMVLLKPNSFNVNEGRSRIVLQGIPRVKTDHSHTQVETRTLVHKQGKRQHDKITQHRT